jgi:hypothetical protein
MFGTLNRQERIYLKAESKAEVIRKLNRAFLAMKAPLFQFHIWIDECFGDLDLVDWKEPCYELSSYTFKPL